MIEKIIYTVKGINYIEWPEQAPEEVNALSTSYAYLEPLYKLENAIPCSRSITDNYFQIIRINTQINDD